jgi:ABC-type bacteriocin/lantibiotic exporter with double-glycine peptidase domain
VLRFIINPLHDMLKFAGSKHPESEPIFYNHLTDLFIISQANGKLEFDDLGSLPEDASVNTVHTKFLQQWVLDKMGSPMIWSPLFKTIGSCRLFVSVILRVIMVGGSFAQPLLLEALTKYQQNQIYLSPTKKWILISLVFIIPVIKSVCRAHSESYFRFFGVQVRNALNAEIYKKTLGLNPTARAKYSSAEISNLFTQDTEFVERFLSQVSNIVLFPLQIGAALFLSKSLQRCQLLLLCSFRFHVTAVYYQVGNAMFVGFAYIIALFPFLLVVAFFMEHYLKRYMGEKDVRLAELNEVISGIRIVKNYAWEDAFCNSILALRRAEMESLVTVANIWNVSQILFASIPVVLPIVSVFKVLHA